MEFYISLTIQLPGEAKLSAIVLVNPARFNASLTSVKSGPEVRSEIT